jgi:CHAT domain-containing protein
MATLWAVADNSTPWLMREFYRTRLRQTLNKAEALRRAQLALLNGKAVAAPTTRKRASRVQVLVGDAGGRAGASTRADLVFVEARNAVRFRKDRRKPFSHPYYWSPFVLYGNWR